MRQGYEASAQAATQAIEAAQSRHAVALEQLNHQLQTAQAAHQQAGLGCADAAGLYCAPRERTASLWQKFKGLFKELPVKAGSA